MESTYYSQPTRCHMDYITSVPGILKIVEMIFAILTFSCSFGGGYYWNNYMGGGWVEFVGITSLIFIGIWFTLHFFNCVPDIMVNFLIELVGYALMTVCFLIAGIVAAVGADKYYIPDAVGAACFFAFAAMIVCGIDSILQIRSCRAGALHSTTTTTTATTLKESGYLSSTVY